jgi:hypothetical protein
MEREMTTGTSGGVLLSSMCYTGLHSKIERGDQEDSDGGVLLVRRSRADAGNEAR